MTTLADIAPGERARVRQITGSDVISLRLLEMGLTPGCELELVGVAPFGDPIEISLRGYRLSLRKSEAVRVEIEPLQCAPEGHP
jgi:ferrous iron transport protein A